MIGGKRCAIVTGGARGIGRGISLALAKDGYAVCAAGTKPASDERVAAYLGELTSLSPESFYCQCDISSAEDRMRLMDEAWGRFGTVEVLVNNAGVAPLQRNDILEMTEESYDRVMGINCRSVFFLTQEIEYSSGHRYNQRFHARVFIEHQIHGLSQAAAIPDIDHILLLQFRKRHTHPLPLPLYVSPETSCTSS